jgi:hypothetical protein
VAGAVVVDDFQKCLNDQDIVQAVGLTPTDRLADVHEQIASLI